MDPAIVSDAPLDQAEATKPPHGRGQFSEAHVSLVERAHDWPREPEVDPLILGEGE